MTGEIRFKMRSEPTRMREAPAAPSPAPQSGKGSFDDEAMAALEAVLGNLGAQDAPEAVRAVPQVPAPSTPPLTESLASLEATLPLTPVPMPAPEPEPEPEPLDTTTTTQPRLRTARELIEAMDTRPYVRPQPVSALAFPQDNAEVEPPFAVSIEPDPKPPQPKELRNGDLPPRPAAPVAPDRPRRALAPPLEPPDFQLSAPKRRGFKWPFGR